jgi:hypothetical protein
MTHKSKEACVGSSTYVATERSNFTSTEFHCTSNVSQVARKKGVCHHRIIHVEQLISFKLILRQNICDGDKVSVDLSQVRWS